MKYLVIAIVFFITLSGQVSAQSSFDYPFKVGSYFEYLYQTSTFDFRYTAKINRDTIINGKKFAVQTFYNEPGRGNYNIYLRIDTVTLNIFNGTDQYCPDSSGNYLEGGFKLPIGYIWNTCDTSDPYVRSYITDTSTFLNIFNTGIPLKTFTRKDTITGTLIEGVVTYFFTEKFGYFAYAQDFSGPFGPFGRTLKGAIIDSVMYGQILLKVNKISSEVPAGYILNQNYPNPFNPNTKIRFSIPKTNKVSLIVYDQLGREMKRLVDEKLSAGTYEYNFESNNLTSGVYYYTLRSGDFIETKRMVLVK
ncbi:MAG: T9SS type A sorting domain-containing protein [Ignavibacteriae bacterium]|nr:T9SS type A sorting domain-containing protein [Ignavibacteriota bacterium]